MEPTSPSPVISADRTFGRAPKKSNRVVIILIILAIIIVGVFIGLRGSNNEENSEDEITPTIEITEEPTVEPTESEENLSPTKKPTPSASEVTEAYDMRIQVQNGSGEVGIAGQAAAHLKSKGYENVETDNADNYDYTGVTVRIKSTRSKFLNTLLTDLKEKYDSAEEGDALSSSSDFDALVIIGK